MARPRKDKRLLLSVILKLPLTADQKMLIEEAARLEQTDVTTFVRPIVVKAARERIAQEIVIGGKIRKR